MRYVILCILLLSACSGNIPRNEITLTVMGDSLSKGQSWLSLTEALLEEEGFNITLRNLATEGAKTQQVIQTQLPLIQDSDHVIVFIGTNDYFNDVPDYGFKSHLTYIAKKLPKGSIFITIPDLSIAPKITHAQPRISDEIRHYNTIIKDVADSYSMRVIDIFPASQTMYEKHFSEDGFHPSYEGHLLWAKEIAPMLAAFIQNEVKASSRDSG